MRNSLPPSLDDEHNEDSYDDRLASAAADAAVRKEPIRQTTGEWRVGAAVYRAAAGARSSFPAAAAAAPPLSSPSSGNKKSGRLRRSIISSAGPNLARKRKRKPEESVPRRPVDS